MPQGLKISKKSLYLSRLKEIHIPYFATQKWLSSYYSVSSIAMVTIPNLKQVIDLTIGGGGHNNWNWHKLNVAVKSQFSRLVGNLRNLWWACGPRPPNFRKGHNIFTMSPITFMINTGF